MPLLWETAAVIQYAITALLSAWNAVYFLSRRWPTRRMRAGACTLALVSLGVSLQGLYVEMAVLRQPNLEAGAAKGWLFVGSLGLAGALLVALWALRHSLRR